MDQRYEVILIKQNTYSYTLTLFSAPSRHMNSQTVFRRKLKTTENTWTCQRPPFNTIFLYVTAILFIGSHLLSTENTVMLWTGQLTVELKKKNKFSFEIISKIKLWLFSNLSQVEFGIISILLGSNYLQEFFKVIATLALHFLPPHILWQVP